MAISGIYVVIEWFWARLTLCCCRSPILNWSTLKRTNYDRHLIPAFGPQWWDLLAKLVCGIYSGSFKGIKGSWKYLWIFQCDCKPQKLAFMCFYLGICGRWLCLQEIGIFPWWADPCDGCEYCVFTESQQICWTILSLDFQAFWYLWTTHADEFATLNTIHVWKPH